MILDWIELLAPWVIFMGPVVIGIGFLVRQRNEPSGPVSPGGVATWDATVPPGGHFGM